jgi:hypothetical protein
VTRRAPDRKSETAATVTHTPSQLAPLGRFLSRIVRSGALAATLVAITLAVGVIGYHQLAHLDWLAAFHQSALLLSGMGPVELNLNDAGRVFESIYALFCGVILLGAAGILFAPVLHRLLHRFHLEDHGT